MGDYLRRLFRKYRIISTFTKISSYNRKSTTPVIADTFAIELKKKSIMSKKQMPLKIIEDLSIEDVEDEDYLTSTVFVYCKIAFTRMGTIDTIKERFDCNAYIECYWDDDKLFRSIVSEISLKNESDSVIDKVREYMCTFYYDPDQQWSPDIYIENTIGDLKEEKTYRCEVVSKKKLKQELETQYTIRVFEMNYVRGTFYERLELQDFPLDLQELTITVTSLQPDYRVKLVENQTDRCAISTGLFLNEQEWDLFEYVKCSEKKIYDRFKKYNRTALNVTSFIARKAGYYINNAYLLIFLITALGFVPFSVDFTQPHARSVVSGVLILTQVNFRWIITQRIPSVSYLTLIDKYAIGNLFFLVLLGIWHSIIGSNLMDEYQEIRAAVDSYVLFFFLGSFTVYTVFNAIWLVKLQRRIQIKRFYGVS